MRKDSNTVNFADAHLLVSEICEGGDLKGFSRVSYWLYSISQKPSVTQVTGKVVARRVAGECCLNMQPLLFRCFQHGTFFLQTFLFYSFSALIVIVRCLSIRSRFFPNSKLFLDLLEKFCL